MSRGDVRDLDDPLAFLEDRENSRDRFGSKRRKDDGFRVEDVEVIHATPKAILVRGAALSKPDPFGTVGADAEDIWIPITQLHGDNMVTNVGDRGLLVITTWLAEKKGLV